MVEEVFEDRINMVEPTIEQRVLAMRQGNPFLCGSGTAAQQQAPLNRPMTAQERAREDAKGYGSHVQDEINRMRRAGDKFPNLGTAFDRKKGRKTVESKVVEPRMLNA